MVGGSGDFNIYLINRSTNTVHLDMTPYELAYKIKPQMDHLRVFGSQRFVHINDVKRTKLEPKSFKFIFLGYAVNVKVIVCLTWKMPRSKLRVQ